MLTTQGGKNSGFKTQALAIIEQLLKQYPQDVNRFLFSRLDILKQILTDTPIDKSKLEKPPISDPIIKNKESPILETFRKIKVEKGEQAAIVEVFNKTIENITERADKLAATQKRSVFSNYNSEIAAYNKVCQQLSFSQEQTSSIVSIYSLPADVWKIILVFSDTKGLMTMHSLSRSFNNQYFPQNMFGELLQKRINASVSHSLPVAFFRGKNSTLDISTDPMPELVGEDGSYIMKGTEKGSIIYFNATDNSIHKQILSKQAIKGLFAIGKNFCITVSTDSIVLWEINENKKSWIQKADSNAYQGNEFVAAIRQGNNYEIKIFCTVYQNPYHSVAAYNIKADAQTNSYEITKDNFFHYGCHFNFKPERLFQNSTGQIYCFGTETDDKKRQNKTVEFVMHKTYVSHHDGQNTLTNHCAHISNVIDLDSCWVWIETNGERSRLMDVDQEITKGHGEFRVDIWSNLKFKPHYILPSSCTDKSAIPLVRLLNVKDYLLVAHGKEVKIYRFNAIDGRINNFLTSIDTSEFVDAKSTNSSGVAKKDELLKGTEPMILIDSIQTKSSVVGIACMPGGNLLFFCKGSRTPDVWYFNEKELRLTTETNNDSLMTPNNI